MPQADPQLVPVPDETRAEVARLVELYRRNEDHYRSPSYNETEARIQFINPFFEALGWDMANRHGYAEPYRDVVHEDSIKVGGAVKAPDYSFRIGGQRRFFLEAKKPSVSVRDDAGPAYQLRRYGWSAHLPLSVLTDFEELAVYDCRLRPKPTDAASVARINILTYDQYLDRLDDLYSVFSKEAILRGSFDRYAADTARKRGTTEVDDEFLKEIEAWRDLLARDLALHNSALSVPDLNFAVQSTIDRLLFLRIAEDRGVEPYGRLRDLASAPGIYPRLCAFFLEANDKYNAGLFNIGKTGDALCMNLRITDKSLKDILSGLYYPQSPYEFSVLGADILGAVYEQFLGKVIRLTAGHRAVVEEKPEVRKAGGVYYTPRYIVDYIVEYTVGEAVNEAGSPDAVAKLCVLDPACGSGSFLLGAYQYLLDWHLRWYLDHDPGKLARRKKPVLVPSPAGGFCLSTAERKRILLSAIFGVDLDPQAVEVAKLNLLLKCMEGETAQSADQSMKLFHERLLPNLDRNIKCGNSLIGPDYFEGRSLALVDPEELRRVRPFDWRAEFPEIMGAGGFDCVIGNPPWGADFAEGDKRYLDTAYVLNSGKYESYIYFIERATSRLRPEGLFGFIVPSYWVSRSQTTALRRHLSRAMTPRCFVILPDNVFHGVKMDSCIVIAQMVPSVASKQVVRTGEVQSGSGFLETAGAIDEALHPVAARQWAASEQLSFNPRVTEDDVPVFARVEANAEPLGDIVDITQGLTLYRRSTLAEMYGAARAEEIVSKRLFHASEKRDDTFKMELWGRDVARYAVRWNGTSWVSYGPWLAHAVDERFFRGPRLVIQKIRNPSLKQRLVAGYLDDNDTYSAGVLLNAVSKGRPYSLLYVLGLLNSVLINYWYRKLIVDVSIRVVDLKEVPIRAIDFSEPADARLHGRVVSLVEAMLDLHKRLADAKNPSDRDLLQRQIDATDRQIDILVYELYGLTDDEIAIVEAATAR